MNILRHAPLFKMGALVLGLTAISVFAVIAMEIVPVNTYYEEGGWLGTSNRYCVPGGNVTFTYLIVTYDGPTHTIDVKNVSTELPLAIDRAPATAYEHLIPGGKKTAMQLTATIPEDASESARYTINLTLVDETDSGSRMVSTEQLVITVTNDTYLHNTAAVPCYNEDAIESGYTATGTRFNGIDLLAMAVVVALSQVALVALVLKDQRTLEREQGQCKTGREGRRDSAEGDAP